MNKLFVNVYFCKKLISGVMAFIFAVGTVGTSYAQSVVPMSAPGTMASLSTAFAPSLLKGVKVYADNPFRLDFILDKGEDVLSDNSLKTESERLIRYFLASVTVPEDDLWVNLSPYEKDRIVPDAFGVTQMGRDLLAQDYLLKQITASVIYPEGEVGKAFWAKVYAEAEKHYGTTDIPIDTFNKVWIVPEKAVVYEGTDSAYVVESRLKVMLETDYLAMSKNDLPTEGHSPRRGASRSARNTSVSQTIAQEVLQEIIIPILEKEVNEGKNFAQLRQVYHSLILAVWYKDKIKESVFGKAYVDQKKIAGVDIEDKAEKEKIWAQYVEIFKKGAYNYIKEDLDPATQQSVPRKYFSGGLNMRVTLIKTHESDMLLERSLDNAMIIKADMVMAEEVSITAKLRNDVVSQPIGNNQTNRNALYIREMRTMDETLLPIRIGQDIYQIADETSLSIVMTDICNGNCAFCINKTGIKHSGEAVAQHFAQKIRRAINTYHVKDVVLLGGEPLLAPNLREVLSELGRVKDRLDEITITTNGTQFKDRSILELVGDSVVTSVNISYHHYDKKRNDAIMEMETLTIEEIEDINRFLMFKGKTVRINLTAFKGGIDNVSDLEKFVDSFSNKIDVIKLTPVYPTASYETIDSVSEFTESRAFSRQEWMKLLDGLSTKGDILSVHEDIFGVVRTLIRLPSGVKILFVNPYTDQKEPTEIRSIKILSDGRMSLSWLGHGPDLLTADVEFSPIFDTREGKESPMIADRTGVPVDHVTKNFEFAMAPEMTIDDQVILNTIIAFIDKYDRDMEERRPESFYEDGLGLLDVLENQVSESIKHSLKTDMENRFVVIREKIVDMLGTLRLYAWEKNNSDLGKRIDRVSHKIFGNNPDASDYQNFRKFILSSRRGLELARLGQKDRLVVFVMGHKNPDTDAVVSSLLEAYRNYLINPNVLFIPVVQGKAIPDEVRFLFGDSDLMDAIVLSTESDYLSMVEERRAQWILVDHNTGDVPGEILSILDHHAISKENFDENIAQTIEMTGSTTGLVTARFQGMGVDLTGQLARVAFGATLMDTENRNASKMTWKDRQVMDMLSQRSRMDEEGGASAFYQGLMSALLSSNDDENIFYRDYKQDHGFGFAILKKKGVFDHHTGSVKNEESLQRIKRLAQQGNRDNNISLTLVKVVDYEDDNETVFKERMYFVFVPGVEVALQKRILDFVEKIVRDQFSQSSLQINRHEDFPAFIEWSGVKKQLSRKAVTPLLAPVIREMFEVEPAVVETQKAVEQISDSQYTGGIDLTRDKMDLQVQSGGKGVEFKFNPATIQQLQNASGLTPVIIDIQPMTTTVPMFLGVKDISSVADLRG